MKNRIYKTGMRGSAKRFVGFPALALAILAVGCGDLLDVSLPGDLVEENVFLPENAELLVNSAIADFECSFSMMSATLTSMGDVQWPGTGGTFGGTHGDYENERPGGGHCPENNATGTSWWHGYERARLFSETVYDLMANDAAWSAVDDRDELMATAAVYAALYYDFIGSVFCEYAFEGEALVPPSNVLARGETWLTTALGIMGTGDFSINSTTSLKELAYLVRARIRRTLGNNDAGAMADALLVSPGFEAFVTRDVSERGRWNEVNNLHDGSLFRTVAGPTWWFGDGNPAGSEEFVAAGMWNLTIDMNGTGFHTVADGMPDPRVAETKEGTPIGDGFTPFHRQLKYPNIGDSQRMASWQEAQLILAEIERGASAVARINAIRLDHGLPDLVTVDPDEIFTAIVEERRREFFLEGSRHYMDKLRFGLWFPRGVGQNRVGDNYEIAYCLLPPTDAYELNANVPVNFTGPDLQGQGYRWELEIANTLQWPVPATLPRFDVMDEDAIPWLP